MPKMSKIQNPWPSSGRPKSKIPDDSGMILAAVLILLGVITALILEIQVLARASLVLEQSRLTRTQLRKSAGDGVWNALNLLAADENLLVDFTNELWAAPVITRLPSGIQVETVVIDENRFIDANILAYLSPSQAQRPTAYVVRDLLSAGQSFDPELQTRIIQDWVDQNSDGDYEAPYYRRLPGKIEIANTPVESRDELLWLLKSSTNSFAEASALTVLPGQATHIEPINVNTADRQTLLAVFGEGNKALVERIILLRQRMPLADLEQILDPQLLQRLAAYISVRSSYFSIYSRAGMDFAEETVYALVKRGHGGNVQILRWVER